MAGIRRQNEKVEPDYTYIDKAMLTAAENSVVSHAIVSTMNTISVALARDSDIMAIPGLRSLVDGVHEVLLRASKTAMLTSDCLNK